MKTVLLKMAGPLQSWGTSSYFETRKTDYYPSKSAVIGMIAACLGYERNSDDEIRRLNELDFAVRVDQPGRLMMDYHTAAKYKPNGNFDRTYVTHRYYLQDAVFVVAVGHSDSEFIEMIERGLRYPYFQPFMGRRALPLPADFIIASTDCGVIESLKKEPWKAADWYRQKHSSKLDIYADAELIAGATEIVRKDRVISFSNKERRFSYRIESHLELELESEGTGEEHDAFATIGGQNVYIQS